MAITFDLQPGSDLTLNRDDLTIVRKFVGRDKIPTNIGGDYFDYAASTAMSWITNNYPVYQTWYGKLYWNSIQIHENHYAQSYDLSVTYSPRNKSAGSYQITVDQAVGTQKVTAGTWIDTYAVSDDDKVPCDGTFDDGTDVTGIDVPVAEDKLTISFRHPQGYLNRAYIRAIGRLRGYPNSDPFLDYESGEVVYMGGQFTETETEASAQYHFSISPNATNLVVAGITIASKSGWDALCPVYKPDATANDAGKKHARRKLKCIHKIRPRDWKAYRSVFGWG